jgi:hypothetical protein
MSVARRSAYACDTTLWSDDGEDWEADDWYWEPKFGGYWVHTGNKRVRSKSTGNKGVRRKSMANRLERKWVLGMRRNWNTDKKATMVANIIIKRENVSMIRSG